MSGRLQTVAAILIAASAVVAPTPVRAQWSDEPSGVASIASGSRQQPPAAANTLKLSHAARFDGSSYGERLEQRDRRSLFGAAMRYTGNGNVAGLPSSASATVQIHGETLNADGVFDTVGRQPIQTVREDRLRQASAGLTIESRVQLAERVRSAVDLRYDSYRFGVSSDLEGHAGSRTGGVFSPSLSLAANPWNATELFVNAGRGLRSDDPRSPGAVFDPRSGVPVGRLDPLATTATVEAGVRGEWLPAVTTTFSMFRAKTRSELLFTGDTGIAEFARPAFRDGLQVAARYEPKPWLALDFQAAALRARFADGAHEYIPGAAERNASAGATLRVPSGWIASLLVSYFGKREPVQSDAARLKSSSFVNARLTRNLSKTTRVTFDVFNVFDQRVNDIDYFSASRIWNQPGAADSFLFNPAEPRGFRVKLRTTF